MAKISKKASMFRGMCGLITGFDHSFIANNPLYDEDDLYGNTENIYFPTKHLQDFEHLPEYQDKIEDDFIGRLENILTGELYKGYFTNERELGGRI